MKIFEVTFIKTELNLDESKVFNRTLVYQVIAKSEIDAALKTGQTFNNSSDYEIEIKRIKLIK